MVSWKKEVGRPKTEDRRWKMEVGIERWHPLLREPVPFFFSGGRGVFLEEGSRKRPQITNNKLEILNIKAVIYDMDGLIIDSEPLWREAEKITFKSVGHIFTDDMCRETMGMRLTEVVQYWHDKLGWNGKSLEQVEEELLARVTQLIIEKGEALEGVESSLQYFKSKGYKIALASSSHKNLIKTVLKKLNITHYFEVINSAEQLTYGKPHPMLFINTAEDIGVKPTNCLVIEDSFHGLIAAKAALMKTIVVPDKENWDNPNYNIADFNLKSLNQIKELNFG